MKITNKKGLHNYFILESFEAGVKLTGAEVKSIKMGRVDLSESFVRVLNGQLILINTSIPRYQNSSIPDYNPTRDRVLLIHKNQISSLLGKLSRAGFTLIPVSIYETGNLIKVEVGIAKSKQKFDKRRVLKEKDNLRRIEQELRGKE